MDKCTAVVVSIKILMVWVDRGHDGGGGSHENQTICDPMSIDGIEADRRA